MTFLCTSPNIFIILIDAVGYQSSNPLHHEHMCSLLMTSCDLSSCCKSWDWAKKVSDLIYAEFFRQGDLEKALGHTPIEMMDRDKAFIPEQQLGFIDSIAGPAYRYICGFKLLSLVGGHGHCDSLTVAALHHSFIT